MFNDDYNMNMTEKYIKGILIKLNFKELQDITDYEKNNFYRIGWNTSTYLGEFQSQTQYVVEFKKDLEQMIDQSLKLLEI